MVLSHPGGAEYLRDLIQAAGNPSWNRITKHVAYDASTRADSPRYSSPSLPDVDTG